MIRGPFKFVDQNGSYAMDHSTYTYLMNRRSCCVRHFRHDTAPKVMAKNIRKAV